MTQALTIITASGCAGMITRSTAFEWPLTNMRGTTGQNVDRFCVDEIPSGLQCLGYAAVHLELRLMQQRP